MGYGTQPHDCELDELESMKGLLIVCLSPHATSIQVTPCYVAQPIVADQHECQPRSLVREMSAMVCTRPSGMIARA
jgi:hypothetical protein